MNEIVLAVLLLFFVCLCAWQVAVMDDDCTDTSEWTNVLPPSVPAGE